MEDFDFEESEREQQRIERNFTRTEEEGLKNILKHFDRIHDKLFTFNRHYQCINMRIFLHTFKSML